jgi:hypothetical protein
MSNKVAHVLNLKLNILNFLFENIKDVEELTRGRGLKLKE